MKLTLASQSPRRRELMRLITPHFETCVADFVEEAVQIEDPARLAVSLAIGKGRAAAAEIGEGIVIGCDTVVELHGKTLGKPHSKEEAAEMIAALSGNMHLVHTGVALIQEEQERAFTVTTAVYFADVPKHAREAYVQTEEPYDKAGAYGIQGWAAKYIHRIDGCYYNVMGLPVADLYRELQKFGVEI